MSEETDTDPLREVLGELERHKVLLERLAEMDVPLRTDAQNALEIIKREKMEGRQS